MSDTILVLWGVLPLWGKLIVMVAVFALIWSIIKRPLKRSL